jgi:hypothetical protein
VNPFAKHGIRHLSPSSLLTYQANPAMWVGKYMFNWKDEAGPRAWLGNAVETGLHSWLSGAEDYLARALTAFEFKAQGEVSNDIAEAANQIEPMLNQAIQCYASEKKLLPQPLYQVKCEHWIDGIEVPLIGYLDFQWDGRIDDLKTTQACPTKPRDDHLAQIGMYFRSRNVTAGRLVYVTPKRSNPIPVTLEDTEQPFQSLIRSARAVRHLLSRVRDRDDAIRLFAPDFSDFRWNDATKKMALEALNA